MARTTANISYLSFNGNSDVITVPNNKDLNFTSAITVELFINPSATQVSYCTPLSKSNQWTFEMNGSSTLFTFQFWVQVNSTGQSSGFPSGSFAFPTGSWGHLAATYDSVTHIIIVYYNGIQVVSNTLTSLASYTINSNTNPLLIGNRQGFSRYFGGGIDDIRIWNVALTSSDILSHSKYPSQISAPNTANCDYQYNCKAHYKCNEGSGLYLNNSTTFGEHGIFTGVGSPSWTQGGIDTIRTINI